MTLQLENFVRLMLKYPQSRDGKFLHGADIASMLEEIDSLRNVLLKIPTEFFEEAWRE